MCIRMCRCGSGNHMGPAATQLTRDTPRLELPGSCARGLVGRHGPGESPRLIDEGMGRFG